MKKIGKLTTVGIIGILFLMITSSVQASEFGKYSGFGIIGGANSYTEIKVGYLNPDATNGGLLLGIQSGSQVDETVSLGLELNYWRKKFEKKVNVDVDTSIVNIPTTTTKVLYKHTVHYIPILATLKINIPVGPDVPVAPFAGASLGYAFAHIGYKFNDPDVVENGVTSSPDKGYYGGWNWRVFGGASFAIGSMSNLNLGVMYNGAKVSKSESGGVERELDLDGLGFYASVVLLGM
ncbi:MAG: hypothetical protein GY855_01945 [candidate division Zixibacteria bacterium]|nr:hypothetical protein [candidate division Zixibacteria bacterium]